MQAWSLVVSTIAILDPGGRLEVPRQGESGANQDGDGFLAVIACQGGPEEASMLRTLSLWTVTCPCVFLPPPSYSSYWLGKEVFHIRALFVSGSIAIPTIGLGLPLG